MIEVFLPKKHFKVFSDTLDKALFIFSGNFMKGLDLVDILDENQGREFESVFFREINLIRLDYDYFDSLFSLAESCKGKCQHGHFVVNENEFVFLKNMCEYFSRLYMGQISHFFEYFLRIKLNEFEAGLLGCILFPKREQYMVSAGIPFVKGSRHRYLWDIYQHFRFFGAWMNENNTPKTRKFPEQISVCYDFPLNFIPESKNIKIISH